MTDDKNWLERALSKVTEPMWNNDRLSDETSPREITNRHQRMTREEAEELKKYLKDPARYSADTRFKILEQKLRFQNESTAEEIDSGKQFRYTDQSSRDELERRADEP